MARLDQIPPAVAPAARYLRPSRDQIRRERLIRECPACGAEPGQECDGSRIQRFEGMHFARHETFQWPQGGAG